MRATLGLCPRPRSFPHYVFQERSVGSQLVKKHSTFPALRSRQTLHAARVALQHCSILRGVKSIFIVLRPLGTSMYTLRDGRVQFLRRRCTTRATRRVQHVRHIHYATFYYGKDDNGKATKKVIPYNTKGEAVTALKVFEGNRAKEKEKEIKRNCWNENKHQYRSSARSLETTVKPL